MAVPKKRSSKARRRRRELQNSVLTLPEVYRTSTGNVVRRHHVDLQTGMYRGRQVLDVDGKNN